MYKLCIDIGTTTVKCVLFADRLTLVADAAREYTAHVTEGVYVEQSAEDWWRCAVETVGEVLGKSGVPASAIRAIGVSGQTPTLLPLDGDGNPLCNAMIWLDRRAADEAAELRERIGVERLFEIGGKKLDAYHIPPKILWLRRHRPELYEKARMYVQCNGFINYRLTGQYTCDRSDAAISFLYDLRRDCWSEEILAALSITGAQLPPICDGDALIGHVTARAAAETGLAAGTPVIAGYVDASAASLEAGLLKPGTALEATGTASTLRVGFDEIKYSPYLSSGVGLRRGTGSLFGEMSGTGASMRWLRDMLAANGRREKLTYPEMDQLVREHAPNPTHILYLPYPTGERSPIWNGEARGVFFGMDLSTQAADLIRAVMEGTSFALRTNVEAARKAGVGVERLRSVGGCCRSDVWLGIKSSIVNMPIEVPDVSIGAPAGIAMLTATCTGEFASVEEAMSACVRVKKTVLPEPRWVEYYNRMFETFCSLYEHTIPDFTALTRLPSLPASPVIP